MPTESDLTARRVDQHDPPFMPEWVSSLLWPALIALGLVVIQVTSNPILGAVIGCSKLGWGEIATAFWVRRHDARTGRGRAIFWFTLAYAACKIMTWSVAVSAVLLFTTAFVVVVILPRFGPAGRAVAEWLDHDRMGMAPALAHMGIAGGLVFFPVVAFTGIACLTAKRHRTRVWIDASLDRSRRHRTWPPLCDGRRNRADTVLLISIASLMTATMPGMIVVAVELKWASPVLAIVAFLAVGSLSFLVCSGVLAQAPQDCWGDCCPRESQSTAAPLYEERTD